MNSDGEKTNGKKLSKVAVICSVSEACRQFSGASQVSGEDSEWVEKRKWSLHWRLGDSYELIENGANKPPARVMLKNKDTGENEKINNSRLCSGHTPRM